ncbi:Hsp20/alpha crystallin family protein [Consotaella salsifontis]|uniref:Heat shock protein Hsp20 n=1 Tax=Consotaella salsifontis TaxID=1365950 RepID=A0A1T4SWS5_9HYPH|nr:Hsp20/alpha crystallin family protein [Consotaella salsifontis]SKA32715.1 heat shock protein Hsp20 [Consotaella salsifontis]
MSMRDLIPWTRNDKLAPTSYGIEDHPLFTLQREMDRFLDNAWRRFAISPNERDMFASGWPSMEMSETEREIRVTAEIPGLDEKDVEVLFDNGVLTLKGVKKSEVEDKERQFSERFFGRFERRLAIGDGIDRDHIDASFKNGVLTIVLPKTEEAKAETKRIPIKRQ